MHPDSIPIPYEGGELHLGPVTDKVKQAYCAWLKPRTILGALQILDDARAENKANPGTFSDDEIKRLEINSQLAMKSANAGAITWTADPSPDVAAALNTEPGTVKLARLMFAADPTVRAWSDAQLYAYLQANGGEDTPYGVAFRLQWEAGDPKAKRPAAGSAGRTDTPASTTSSPEPTPSV